MRKLFIVLLPAMTVLALAGPVNASDKHFVAHLSARDEVPSNESLATGQAILRLNADATQLDFKLIAAKKDTDYVGTGGSVDFDDNGDVKTPVAIWKWTDTGTEDVKIVPAADIPSE